VCDSTLLAAGNCSGRTSLAVMPPLVFLGPTLRRAEAASLTAAEFRSAARRGDIYRGLFDGYTTIVLIVVAVPVEHSIRAAAVAAAEGSG
jgi:hypothetical protein